MVRVSSHRPEHHCLFRKLLQEGADDAGPRPCAAEDAGNDAAVDGVVPGDVMVVVVDGKTVHGARRDDGTAPHLLAITCEEAAEIADPMRFQRSSRCYGTSAWSAQ